MTDTLPSAAVGRELGGCPVMHRDFSRAQAAGCHWELANELRESSPLFFNTFAQGYWVFTRHDAVQRHLQDPGDLLQRVDHAVGAGPDLPVRADAGRPARPHQVPAHPQPVVLAARRWTPPSRGCATSAAASSRTWRRPAGATSSTEFALRFPTEAFLSVIGIDRRRRGHVRAVGRGLLRRLRRRSRRRRGHGRGARGHPRVLGRRAGGAPRRARAAAGRPRRAPAPRDLRRASARRTPRCSTC